LGGVPAGFPPRADSRQAGLPETVAHPERHPRRQEQRRIRVPSRQGRARGSRRGGPGPPRQDARARRRGGRPEQGLRPVGHLPRHQGQVRQHRRGRIRVRALLHGPDDAEVEKGPRARQHQHGQLCAHRAPRGRRGGPAGREEPGPRGAHRAAVRGRAAVLERAAAEHRRLARVRRQGGAVAGERGGEVCVQDGGGHAGCLREWAGGGGGGGGGGAAGTAREQGRAV
ncbi:hypothetical protein E4U41_005095, partial [Claviceps citrina]